MVEFEFPRVIHSPYGVIQLWRIPFSNFLPQMLPSFLPLQYKGMVYYGRLCKKVEISLNKISLWGSKWSSLNTPGSETPVPHSFLMSSLTPFSPRAAERRFPSNKIKRRANARTAVKSPCTFFLPSSLCNINKLFIMGHWEKGRTFLEQNQFNILQMV